MRLNIAKNLFLGESELNHLQTSLGDKGYQRFIQQISLQYGVVKLPSDTAFDALRIEEGTSADKISINPGMTIDDQGESIDIESLIEDVLTIPTDGVERWIKINWSEGLIEEGTVSVSTTGELTGVGTKFTEVLRGLPDFPAKIEFIGSSNTGEYTIASITSDTLAQLNIAAGQLTSESDLQYRIIGTFTPGVVPLTAFKYPLRKDSFEIVAETNATVTAGQQFLLAKVSTDGVTMTISDEREQNIYKIASTQSTSVGLQIDNDMIGLESLRYGGSRNDHQYNYATVGWGLRVDTGDWSYSSNLTQITITDGRGGIYQDLSSIVANEFDDWFVYHKETGQFLRILTTGLSGGNVVLTIESPSSGFTVSGEITVVPSSDGIEFIVRTPTVPSANTSIFLPIHLGVARIPLIAGTANTVEWRHVRGTESSAIQNLNTGDYLPESQHDVDGNVVTTTYSTYTSGDTITPSLNALNHSDDKASRSQDNAFTGSNNTFESPNLVTPNLVKIEGDFQVDHKLIYNQYYTEFDGSTPSAVALTLLKPMATIKFLTSITRTISTASRYSETQGDRIIIENDIDSASGSKLLLKHNHAGIGKFFFKHERNIALSPGSSIEFIWDDDKDAWVEISSSPSYDLIDESITLTDVTPNGSNNPTTDIAGCSYVIQDNQVIADFAFVFSGDAGFTVDSIDITNIYSYLPEAISSTASTKTVSGVSTLSGSAAVRHGVIGAFFANTGDMQLQDPTGTAMTGAGTGTLLVISCQLIYPIS